MSELLTWAETQEKKKDYWIFMVWGRPKSAGKSTFLFSAPTPILAAQMDIGRPSVPPGVDASQIYLLDYPAVPKIIEDKAAKSDKWIRSPDLYLQIIQEQNAIIDGFKAGGPIKLRGREVPLPRTLLVDGMAMYNYILVEGMCAVNNISDPFDMPSSTGKEGAGVQKFYGRRLHNLKDRIRALTSLPCNVGFSAWENKPKKEVDGKIVEINELWPDVGGAMDMYSEGMVDACLYAYSRDGKYFIQTQEDGIIKGLGVRGKYGVMGKIDVTIGVGKKLPWELVLG